MKARWWGLHYPGQPIRIGEKVRQDHKRVSQWIVAHYTKQMKTIEMVSAQAGEQGEEEGGQVEIQGGHQASRRAGEALRGLEESERLR